MVRTPCCEKNGLKKGPWTQEEDQKLIDYIHKHGYGNWRTLPKNAGLQRCGKSCRLRWTNYLRPDIKRGRFSFEEEETIIQLHSILGNKWSAIAARLPGRTDNEIKNYWNTHIRKRLLRMGIDPVTHSPRLDLLDLSSMLNSSNMYPDSAHFSRLLGLQTLINPHLIKLASSLFGHRQNQGLNLTAQHPIGQEANPQIEQTLPQNFPIPSTQHHQNPQYDAVLDRLPGNLESQNYDGGHVAEWQFGNESMMSALTEDYLQMPNYGSCHEPGQSSGPTPSSNYSCNNNFSFQSGLSNISSPSSSPAPLHSNSNSAQNVYSGSSTTEDERESYCSNILKFELSDILDVSGFMYD